MSSPTDIYFTSGNFQVFLRINVFIEDAYKTLLLNVGTGLGSLSGREGGCLIVYHHGAIPVDYMYTVAGIYIATGKIVHSIVHRNGANSEI